MLIERCIFMFKYRIFIISIVFYESINCLAKSLYKGDKDYFPTSHISLKELRDKLNVFNPNAKSEFNDDHTKKHVMLDNDVFDELFDPDKEKNIEDENKPTADEIEKKNEEKKFEDKKNSHLSFLRKTFGIKR